ncbi:hypothetical protein BCR44DRAFT_1497192 [Catenaria anguillulae PL171]|uniref:Ankyrin repeat-containing domain protein n=1 Tax=Catenaria anguillulae PL171 TaxID=765915 RepID=A0A1Y2HXA4_9FUNG|nr:hypothetical protein BCR44DRAFT_1497192 [Catenaria anguillulae PL171]
MSRRDALPTLPLNVQELVLAVIASLDEPPTPFLTLIHVLPPTVVPAAFCSALCTAIKDDFNHVRKGFTGLFRGGDHAHSRFLKLLKPARDHYALGKAIISAACMAGNLSVLDWWKSMPETDPELWMASSSVDAVNGAIAAGHFHVVQWWTRQGHHLPAVSIDSIKKVVERGDTDMLEHLYQKSENEAVFDPVTVLEVAVALGGTDALDWYATLSDPEITDNMWESASCGGHVTVLDWFVKMLWPLPADVEDCVDSAAENGHVNVLDWFFANAGPGSFRYSVWALDKASENGHLAVLEWFALSGLELRFTPQAYLDACEKRHVAVIEWWNKCNLYKQMLVGPSAQMMALGRVPKDSAMLAAFGCGDLIVNQDLMTMDELQFGQVVRQACGFGHVHLLQELQPLIKVKTTNDLVLFYFVSDVIENNQVACLKWLVAQFGKRCWDYANDLNQMLEMNQVISDCAAQGHVEMLTYLNGMGMLESVRSECLEQAAQFASLCVLDLFYAFGWISTAVETSPHRDTVIQAAARSGQISVLEWWQERNLPAPSPRTVTKAIDLASFHGRALVLEWWLKESGWSFLFSEQALWNSIRCERSKNRSSVIRWWINSGLVNGLCMLETLKSAKGCHEI